jgi:GT2 family glycosyltransferase
MRGAKRGERLISLIVATLHRVQELERLLCSLGAQSCRDFEVIVVDQNADHRLAPLLAMSRRAPLVIRHLHSEPGLSRARNAGLRAATGDLIAFPDDDCWYPEHLLASVTGWFDSNPGFGLLSAGVRTAENHLSGPNSPATSRACTRTNVWRCAVSTALFMRRSVTTRIGGFNEGIGVGASSAYQSGEETDYVLRALAGGFSMWYEASLTVHHPRLDSIERLQKNTYPFALGMGRVLRMHHSPLHEVGGHLLRSLGGAAVRLCQGDVSRARLYALRGAGQLVGYVSGQRHLVQDNPGQLNPAPGNLAQDDSAQNDLNQHDLSQLNPSPPKRQVIPAGK